VATTTTVATTTEVTTQELVTRPDGCPCVNQAICDQGCFAFGETYTVFQRISYLVNELDYTLESAGYEITH
jgi:hypothetical protein